MIFLVILKGSDGPGNYTWGVYNLQVNTDIYKVKYHRVINTNVRIHVAHI